MNRRIAIALFAVAAVFALSACTPKPEPVAAPPAPKEPTMVASGVSLTGEALPEGFPADIPLWPNAEVRNSDASGAGGTTQYTLDLQTDEPYANVVDGMLRGVEKAGWTITAQDDLSSAEASAGLVAFNKGKVDVVATLGVASGKTTISLVVTAGK